MKDKREAYNCALCKSPEANHSAWARECPIKVQKQKEARQAYSKRPTYFQERKGVQGSKGDEVIVTPTSSRDISLTSSVTATQIEVPATQFSFTAASKVQLNQLDSEEEDFIEVPAPKRKRGRPTTSTALSKAAKNI